MTGWHNRPGTQPAAFFLVALSLSIGWGIRGNFGHESGAMIAGVLASVAACLVSGRADWQSRVAFFAFYGGLGWGFGGSISYMYPISFAGSEQWQSCIYGFFATFLVGMLWAGLGGMGTALPAVMDRKRLNDFMTPVLFVLGAMGAGSLFIQPWLERAITVPESVYMGGSFFDLSGKSILNDIRWLPGIITTLGACLLFWRRTGNGRRYGRLWLGVIFLAVTALSVMLQMWLLHARSILEAGTLADMHMDSTWNRHQSPLYWYDADWFPALAALLGVCLFDLWDRRFAGIHYLLLFAGLGAGGGALLHKISGLLGLNRFLARILVIVTGDPTAINPDTGLPFSVFSFLSNWPNFALYYPQHLGWLLGLGLGIGLYFYFWGVWRRDSRLLLYLAGGWLLAFLVLPVLGSIPLQFMGGFRLTPPRSDDWAGILGVFIAGMLYCLRYGLGGIALAGSLSGLIGGFFFAFVPFLRALLRLPGHPALAPDHTSGAWAHYQSANWHSIMEQMHGFGHGLALATALAVLAALVKPHEEAKDRKRWPEFIALIFVLFLITLMNVYKNVEAWSGVVPSSMKMPLLKWIELSASTWFLLTWFLLAATVAALMALHLKRPLHLVPASWTGRGQLLYLVFLWIMVIANFERALVSFHENRLVTEWVILLNAALATFLVAVLPRETPVPETQEPEAYAPLVRRLWRRCLPLIACALLLMAVLARVFYGNVPFESGQINHKRWGMEAQWRVKPILKHGQHR